MCAPDTLAEQGSSHEARCTGSLGRPASCDARPGPYGPIITRHSRGRAGTAGQWSPDRTWDTGSQRNHGITPGRAERLQLRAQAHSCRLPEAAAERLGGERPASRSRAGPHHRAVRADRCRLRRLRTPEARSPAGVERARRESDRGRQVHHPLRGAEEQGEGPGRQGEDAAAPGPQPQLGPTPAGPLQVRGGQGQGVHPGRRRRTAAGPHHRHPLRPGPAAGLQGRRRQEDLGQLRAPGQQRGGPHPAEHLRLQGRRRAPRKAHGGRQGQSGQAQFALRPGPQGRRLPGRRPRRRPPAGRHRGPGPARRQGDPRGTRAHERPAARHPLRTEGRAAEGQRGVDGHADQE